MGILRKAANWFVKAFKAVKKFIAKNYKAVWWFILEGLAAAYCIINYEALISEPSAAEISFFALLVVLSLFPFVSQIEFLGFKMQKEVREVKKEVSDFKTSVGESMLELKSNIFEMRTSAISNSQMHNQIVINQQEIKEELESVNIDKKDQSAITAIETPQRDVDLFKIRYDLERRMERIIEEVCGIRSKPNYLKRKIDLMSNSGILNVKEYAMLQNLMDICKRAVHGELLDSLDYDIAKKSYKVINDRFAARGY